MLMIIVRMISMWGVSGTILECEVNAWYELPIIDVQNGTLLMNRISL